MARICPKDQTPLTLAATGENNYFCPACQTHYYDLGILIEDRGQGAPHGKLLTRSLLPRSVIKIKPVETRK